jgi:hypothetical protein
LYLCHPRGASTRYWYCAFTDEAHWQILPLAGFEPVTASTQSSALPLNQLSVLVKPPLLLNWAFSPPAKICATYISTVFFLSLQDDAHPPVLEFNFFTTESSLSSSKLSSKPQGIVDIYTAYSFQRLKRVRNSHSTFITGKSCGGGQCCGSGSGPFCWMRTFLLNQNPDFYPQMWVRIQRWF